jgi:hypothetical protein
LSTWVGRAPAFFLPTRHTGYMQRWSFTVQRSLMRKMMVELGYMGNRGTGQGVTDDLDPVPAQYLSTSPVRDAAVINQLTRQVQNPFFNIPEFAGGGLTGKTVGAQQLMRPYPQFTGLTTVTNNGFSWYHSMQLRVERRFGNGFTISGAYTWSKFMEAVEKLNASDLAPTHVISPQDRPHRVVISGIFELPFGHGRQWLRSRGIGNQIFGGWSAQAIYLGQAGAPIGWGNIIFMGADVHDITLPRSERTVERWFNTDAGWEKASGKALAQNIRTWPLRLSDVRGDGYNNWDISLFKNFRIKERYTMQIRGEAQDAMNHAVFALPNANPTALNFGSIQANAAPEQRRINIAAKFTW